MFRLASILFSLIGTTLAGSAIVVALVMGFDDLTGILAAAVIGGLAGVPSAYLVARKLYEA